MAESVDTSEPGGEPRAAEPVAIEPAAGQPGAGRSGADEEFPDIAHLSYEHARDELIGIVSTLEGGQVPLEESMALWRRGEALAAHCSGWLDEAEATLTQAPPASDAG
jgi:exodeoxyribonuclease VII small subunit